MITFRCEPDCVLTNMTTPKGKKYYHSLVVLILFLIETMLANSTLMKIAQGTA